MNNKTVIILGPNEWDECWREMCDTLGYVPAWCDYPKYFNCVSCDLTDHQIHGHEKGLEIVFEKIEDAVAFKLRWI